MLTPEQRARLDHLRSKPPVRPEPTEPPVHMTHAHWGGPGGMEPCPCPPESVRGARDRETQHRRPPRPAAAAVAGGGVGRVPVDRDGMREGGHDH